MLVGLDATPLLGRRTGIGRYVGGLLPELGRGPTPGTPRPVRTSSRPRSPLRGRGELAALLPAGVRDRSRPAPGPAAAASLVARRERPTVTSLIGRVDVFHGTNFVLPPPGRARGVVTVHDLAFLHSPDTVSATSLRLRQLVPRALASGPPSSARRRRRSPTRSPRRSGVPADRLQVTPLGVGRAGPHPRPGRRLAGRRRACPTATSCSSAPSSRARCCPR